MDRITIVSWSAGDRSLLATILQASGVVTADQVDLVPAGANPAAAAGQRHLAEYDDFAVSTVARFDRAVADGGEDSAQAFRRFVSEDFGAYQDFVAGSERPESPGSRYAVPLARLREDPGPWLAKALAFLGHDLSTGSGTLEQVTGRARDIVAAWPGPDLTGFRYYEPELFDQIGRISLRREMVTAIFRDVLGREPEQSRMLHLQCRPNSSTLRTQLMNSPEYRKKKGPPPASPPAPPQASPRDVPAGVSAMPAVRGGAGMGHFTGVSWPRSGHHMLVRLLQLYFGEQFGYCQFYGTNDTCCHNVPCTRPDIHLSKSHDFEFEVPQIEGRRYLIQYRDFTPSLVSNFELFVRKGGEDSRNSFIAFASSRFGRYQRFVEKWVQSPFARKQLVVRYEDMLADPEQEFARIVVEIDPARPVDRARIAAAVQQVDGESIETGTVKRVEAAGVHADRSIEDFRYYDPHLFELIRRFRRDRTAAISLARKAFGQDPNEDQILIAQAVESEAQLASDFRSPAS